MKTITSGTGVKAEPWIEGKVVAGEFIGAETLPKCESRKLTFRGPTGELAVWETATLAQQVAKMTPGKVYHVECLGKSINTPNGKAWGFDVREAENDTEAAECLEAFRIYLAKGGK